MKRFLAALLASVIVSLAALGPAHAEDLTADQIATKMVKGNGLGWEGAKTRLRMVLIDDKGQKSERSIEVLGRRHDGRLETVVRFLSPADVAGTKFLTLEKPGGGTEQHVYMPGLHRTRRIVGREREGSFMGSDFTYVDMQKKDDPGAKHQRLPDEKIGSEDVYVLETTPSSPEASGGYAKIKTWVRKSDFVPLRTRFFGPSGAVVKTLFVRRIREMEGKPVIVESRMQSEKGHATELIVDELEPKKDLPDSAFSPTSLDR